MSSNASVRIGRLMCLALRHAPDELGLEVDIGGWTSVSALLKGVRSRGYEINRDGLLQIVAEDDKQRYALSSDKTRIRAQQGHSIPVELGLKDATPPSQLFHGTTARSLDAIFREGLMPMKRQHLHLSADIATAAKVGARHGAPLILAVDAAAMVAAGKRFLISGNGVWLIDTVPPLFLRLCGSPEQAAASQGTSA